MRRPLQVASLLLISAALSPIVTVGIAAVRVHRAARRAVSTDGVAGTTAVIFGAQALNDEPGPILRARLDHAIVLYRQGRVRGLAMAGGVPAFADAPSGGHDEVAAAMSYARRQGVPAEHLIAVRPGQNTREQVQSTRSVIVEAELGPVVAVSSSYHLRRIISEARREGFAVAATAPPGSPDIATRRLYASHVLADSMALIWYAVPARLSRHIDTSAGSMRHLALLAMTGDISWRGVLPALHPRRWRSPHR